jgi:hypothetical protein
MHPRLSMNCSSYIPSLHILNPSSKDGFFSAITKFAACIGAAAFAWVLFTPAVITLLMVIRSRVRRFPREVSGRQPGEFAVLGNDIDLDNNQIEEGDPNGNASIERVPLAMYHRLVESAELKPLSPVGEGNFQ